MHGPQVLGHSPHQPIEYDCGQGDESPSLERADDGHLPRVVDNQPDGTVGNCNPRRRISRIRQRELGWTTERHPSARILFCDGGIVHAKLQIGFSAEQEARRVALFPFCLHFRAEHHPRSFAARIGQGPSFDHIDSRIVGNM